MDAIASLCMLVRGASVLMDDAAATVLHWGLGLPKLFQAGAAAVDTLANAVCFRICA